MDLLMAKLLAQIPLTLSGTFMSSDVKSDAAAFIYIPQELRMETQPGKMNS